MAAGPQTLGRYQLERVLGKGAMGIVYEALNPKLHRKVAIKTILISQLDEETAKDFSMRFVREAHAVARLNHPNIVQVYDFGEEGDIAYLVMEFIRGNELKSTLTTGQLFDRKECVRIRCELLDALDFAHEAGVVHRDIKPANVMLDSQGRTKLTDFGVARVTDADRTSAERTQAGTMVGTPAYMSPEQIQGQRIDRRTDIFSAGIILYQFLTGQKPFTGEGAWTVSKKIIQDDPPVPSSINVALSPEFDRVVAKALAKNPDQRVATAREFSQALKRAAEGKRAIPEVEATLVVPREPAVSQATHPEALRSGEMELEFWRSIKDSNDPNDFELYVRQFPQGVYASLAARKAAKLRSGSPADDSGTRTMAGADRTRLQRSVPRAEAEESARAAVDKTIKLADAPSAEPARAGKRRSLLVPVVLGVLVAAGGVTYFVVVKPSPPSTAPKIEAEAKARRDAAEAARAEAQAKRDAQAKAQRDAQAKRDAEAQAKREAEAQAQREAEAQAKRSTDAKAQRAAELKAKREAEAQTKREAELRAKREAEAQAKREVETQAKRESEERAQREGDTRAQREAKVQAQRDAESKAKLAAETSLWDSVKSSRKPADVQKYLKRYPSGQYAEPARQRMIELESARLEEAAKKQKEGEKKKSTIIVPPTF